VAQSLALSKYMQEDNESVDGQTDPGGKP